MLDTVRYAHTEPFHPSNNAKKIDLKNSNLPVLFHQLKWNPKTKTHRSNLLNTVCSIRCQEIQVLWFECRPHVRVRRKMGSGSHKFLAFINNNSTQKYRERGDLVSILHAFKKKKLIKDRSHSLKKNPPMVIQIYVTTQPNFVSSQFK